MARKLTDNELTTVFRRALLDEGYTAWQSYDWRDGAPHHHGLPLDGRATQCERMAIMRTKKKAGVR